MTVGIADTAAHYRQSLSRRQVPSSLLPWLGWKDSEATGDVSLLDIVLEGREKGE